MFWLIYVIMTAAVAIFAVLLVGKAAPAEGRDATKPPITFALTWQSLGKPRDAAALTFLAIFLALYVGMILVWEDFAYYDHSMFTLGTLRGHNIALPIWRVSGRFFPLGHQEFNLIRHFTDTVTGYHLLPIAQLLIFSWILLSLDDGLDLPARTVILVLALLTPSILTSFSGLIFPERNVIFFLACLVLSVKRFDQTRSLSWATAAAVCAQTMIYYKETAFLLLLGLVLGRLLLRYKVQRLLRQKNDLLSNIESRLDLFMTSLAIIYIGLYLYYIGGGTGTKYLSEHQISFSGIVVAYMRLDWLAWVLVVVLLGRLYLTLWHRMSPLPMWDGLALGGVVCFGAYLYLRMYSQYYTAPVDLIAVLYIGRFALSLWKETAFAGKVTVSVLVVGVLIQDVSLSAFAIFDRKNVIHAKYEIASVVEARYQRGAENAPRLFFPFASPYLIAEFGSYLSYRGVPVEGVAAKTAGLSSVVLTTGSIAKDGPCVDWLPPRCHAVSGPNPGDLVIVLPDDEASLTEASVYREEGCAAEARKGVPNELKAVS
jgi:hypothetical protein